MVSHIYLCTAIRSRFRFLLYTLNDTNRSTVLRLNQSTMHLPLAVLIPLFTIFLSGSVDSAKYKNCKCHDANTGVCQPLYHRLTTLTFLSQVQNDTVTKAACDSYKKKHAGGINYSDSPHHQCAKNSDSGGDFIDNGDWDACCKESGQNYYQYCYIKHKCSLFC